MLATPLLARIILCGGAIKLTVSHQLIWINDWIQDHVRIRRSITEAIIDLFKSDLKPKFPKHENQQN